MSVWLLQVRAGCCRFRSRYSYKRNKCLGTFCWFIVHFTVHALGNLYEQMLLISWFNFLKYLCHFILEVDMSQQYIKLTQLYSHLMFAWMQKVQIRCFTYTSCCRAFSGEMGVNWQPINFRGLEQQSSSLLWVRDLWQDHW